MQRQDSSHPTGVAVVSGNNNNTKAVTQARKRKAAAAVKLRVDGADWGHIAEVLGYPTPRAAMVATEACLGDILMVEDRTALRQYAGRRLESLLQSVWSKAQDPDDPEHLLAVGKARDLIDRHAKLYGLDAPTEFVVHSPTMNEIEAWVAQMQGIAAPDVDEFDIIEAEWSDADAVPSE